MTSTRRMSQWRWGLPLVVAPRGMRRSVTLPTPSSERNYRRECKSERTGRKGDRQTVSDHRVTSVRGDEVIRWTSTRLGAEDVRRGPVSLFGRIGSQGLNLKGRSRTVGQKGSPDMTCAPFGESQLTLQWPPLSSSRILAKTLRRCRSCQIRSRPYTVTNVTRTRASQSREGRAGQRSRPGKSLDDDDAGTVSG